MRVLVSAALADFLHRADVPADVAPVLLDDAAPAPEGEWQGMLPHVGRRVDAATLERLPSLRIVANYGVGVDNIDLEAARRLGIAVTNTPDVLTEATAELAWALILAVTRRVAEGERLARSGAWSGWRPTQLLGTGLGGRTLGIVGAGRIGREVGRRARAFGMRVVYWSRTPRPEWEQETGAVRLALDALLESADVVSLHVALSEETRGLIGARQLARMKPGAVLVNTARGAVVDQPALVDALVGARIRAGLDVYDGEPAIPAALRSLEHVVLLPHLGSATREARQAMWDRAWSNLLAGLRGQPLPDPVVPART